MMPLISMKRANKLIMPVETYLIFCYFNSYSNPPSLYSTLIIIPNSLKKQGIFFKKRTHICHACNGSLPTSNIPQCLKRQYNEDKFFSLVLKDPLHYKNFDIA